MRHTVGDTVWLSAHPMSLVEWQSEHRDSFWSSLFNFSADSVRIQAGFAEAVSHDSGPLTPSVGAHVLRKRGVTAALAGAAHGQENKPAARKSLCLPQILQRDRGVVALRAYEHRGTLEFPQVT